LDECFDWFYGSETYTTYARHVKKLNNFHMRCLRHILQIKWQDKIPNTEVLERANMNSVHTTLSERRLRWLGHVKKNEAGRIPKDLFYSELASGARTTGRFTLRYKDVCKTDMRHFGIALSTWESLADDCSTWRQAVRQGKTNADAARDEADITKRARWKQWQQQPQQPSAFIRPKCNRDCHYRVGLHSHSRQCS
jgi:hypothetical protein